MKLLSIFFVFLELKLERRQKGHSSRHGSCVIQEIFINKLFIHLINHLIDFIRF